ncbi:hypothetical protein, partial [Streptomyces tubercidicus]
MTAARERRWSGAVYGQFAGRAGTRGRRGRHTRTPGGVFAAVTYLASMMTEVTGFAPSSVIWLTAL